MHRKNVFRKCALSWVTWTSRQWVPCRRVGNTVWSDDRKKSTSVKLLPKREVKQHLFLLSLPSDGGWIMRTSRHYYAILFTALSPFHRLQNTWPSVTLNGHFMLNFHYYGIRPTNHHLRIYFTCLPLSSFILRDQQRCTEADRDPRNIWDPRKDCGSFVDATSSEVRNLNKSTDYRKDSGPIFSKLCRVAYSFVGNRKPWITEQLWRNTGENNARGVIRLVTI